ncbi:hypothetical protein [Faecousia sp.]|uniref:hypothetical protein n=1 Tax=Faecousia sp. TaxID=2952921 RepID=UPI003AB6B4A7
MKRVSFESLSKKHFFDKLQGVAEAAPQIVEKPIQAKALEGGNASQSLRPQAQRKWKSFFPAACTSEKIPLGSQTCEEYAAGVPFVRCSEPQPFQTRAQ